MSNPAPAKTRPEGNWTLLDKQVTQAKTLLRQMHETVADIEDARTIERAKQSHGKQPRIPWAQAKKELGLP